MFVLVVDGVVDGSGAFMDMVRAAETVKIGDLIEVRRAREGDSVGDVEFDTEDANEEGFDVLPDPPPSGWFW